MTSLTYLTLMTNEEINHLIELAASAYCSRADFDGRRPVINDSDIVQFGGQEAVMLCRGEDILAYYTFSPEGRLRHMTPYSRGYNQDGYS